MYVPRATFKEYIRQYKCCLMGSMSSDIENQLMLLEDQLNALNITIARCQAKIEVIISLSGRE